MNHEPEPSPAEATLQGALQAELPPDLAPGTERQDRIRKAVRAQTAAHDVSHFMLGSVFSALGRVLLTLWNLAAGSIESTKENTNTRPRDRDDNHS